jgi:RNA binding exosome subunit
MNLGKPILEELFNKQIRFRIPVFQRHYVWNEQDQLMPLWEDFLNKYNERLSKKKIHPHYTGSIVLFMKIQQQALFRHTALLMDSSDLQHFKFLLLHFEKLAENILETKALLRN